MSHRPARKNVTNVKYSCVARRSESKSIPSLQCRSCLYILMIHPTLWCQVFFFLLPKANRCSLDLPHLSGITAGDFPLSSPCMVHLGPAFPVQPSLELGRAGQLLQQIHIIAWDGFTAQSPGLLCHIMEMRLLPP